VQPAHQVEMLAPGRVAGEAGLMKGEADRAPHCAGIADGVVSGDNRGPRRRREQRPEHPHRGRLAGPVRPEQAEHLALGDLERHAPNHLHTAGNVFARS
jgi:hypothetical protein